MAAVVASIPLQLVCQLIATSSPISNGNIPPPPALNTSPPQTQSVFLPDGYVAYPSVGAAYKVYNVSVLWKAGRKQCMLEGGNLAVIDSVQKFEYILRQRQSTGITHVGIHSLFDEDEWVSVKTGLPVLSIPWAPGEPTLNGGAFCAMIKNQSGLGNYGCNNFRGNFVCEISIPENYTGDKVMLL